MGLTVSTADALFAHGVDVITSGNHIWDKKEIYPALEANDRILRPLNYGTEGVPGRGWGTYHALDGTELAVINLQGRTYMQPIENPFLVAESLLEEAEGRCHPFGWSTSTARSRPRRTRWASTSTDGSRRWSARTPTSRPPMIGSCRRGRTRATSATGGAWSIIGFNPDTVLPRFLTGLPTRFEVADGPVVFNATQIDVDPATGRALAIERIQRVWEE